MEVTMRSLSLLFLLLGFGFIQSIQSLNLESGFQMGESTDFEGLETLNGGVRFGGGGAGFGGGVDVGFGGGDVGTGGEDVGSGGGDIGSGYGDLGFGGGDVGFGDEKEDKGMGQKNDDFETGFKGEWELVATTSGVSCMHLQIFPKTNKAIMFDATDFGPTKLRLPGACRVETKLQFKGAVDCTAHAVEFDIETSDVRPLTMYADPWCSSGGLAPDGTLVSTGGFYDGGRAVRYLKPCEDCDFKEYPTALSGERWYSTQQILPDGSFILVGGRKQYSYEFVPKEGASNPLNVNYALPFLRQTTDLDENNLYPFVHLSTDGNLFIFANTRSILLNPNTKQVVREFPVLKGGGPRNYPAMGSSALLPIELDGENGNGIPAEVLVCGGGLADAFYKCWNRSIFEPALTSCGRLEITNPKAQWKLEKMPSPRVMGDMLNLPNGDILMLNGAKKGDGGWFCAKEPNFTPVMYKPKDNRFIQLEPTNIARMYHSTAAVLPDGKILVAGSNANDMYKFVNVEFPTELRVEKFSPPYLDPSLEVHRPTINTIMGENLQYGNDFTVEFQLKDSPPNLDKADIKVTMYFPPFTTHGFSQNQRLLVLGTTEIAPVGGAYQITTLAPPSNVVAPPGYYLIFVVYRGVPSKGEWVQIG